jgi:thioredoxin-related protein
MRRTLLFLGLVAFVATPSIAQDRETKVRNDRKTFEHSQDWIYNNLNEGIAVAKKSGKPLMVVFRCIPCEACQQFDDDVARRDPIIRDLLDAFVCVRIVQANAIDLTHFQYDFDQSFSVMFINSDYQVYGRFATRSDRPEHEDISLEGLRAAMSEALKLHKNFDAIKSTLAGKNPKSSSFKTPLEYPSLKGRYTESLNYDDQVTKSCVHCHQIREAERAYFRSKNEPMPDQTLFPYPDPATLGIKLHPKFKARVESVRAGSIADKAGLKAGDDLISADGQPLISIADLQWILHNTPNKAQLAVVISRDGHKQDTKLDLPTGWRHGDISWRTTTWELRRMGLGGMRLDELTAQQRKIAKLAPDSMGLNIRHVGQYGAHAVAKQAGFLKDDIIVGFDCMTSLRTETEVLTYALQTKKPGDLVEVKVLRGDRMITLRYKLQ